MKYFDEHGNQIIRESRRNETLTVGAWVGTLLVLCIPFINIIMLLVWSFGGGETNTTHTNYSRACLICLVVLFFVSILLLY